MADKLTSIWIVTGYTGEYEDMYEWSAAAYATEKDAETYCTLANTWLELNRLDKGDGRGHIWWDSKKLPCPFDSQFNCSHNGAEYRCHEQHIDDASGLQSIAAMVFKR